MTKDIYDALQAIIDGETGEVSNGFITVHNPDATPERIALGGVDPNLVIDAKILLMLLDPR